MLPDYTKFLTCSHAQLLVSYRPLTAHAFQILSAEAIDTLQLLHQLNVMLLGRRMSDLVFDSDFLPCIVLVFLLCATFNVSQESA